MASPRQQPVPVFLLIRTAYQFLWQQRDDALRLAFIPTMVCFGALFYCESAMFSILGHMQAGTQDQIPLGDSITVIAVTLVLLLSMAVLVANWLRFTLLGPMGAVGLGLNIGRPHLGFIAASAALSFVAGIGLTVLSMPLRLLPPVLGNIGFVVALIVALIGLARLLPFAVGQAIGQPISLQRSWNVSRGNGVSLATSLVLVQLPLWIVGVLFSDLLGAVGFASVAPLAMLFIGSVFQSAAAVLHATVLASAFRQIVGVQV